MKQEPIQDSRHNMRMMYAQAMHDQSILLNTKNIQKMQDLIKALQSKDMMDAYLELNKTKDIINEINELLTSHITGLTIRQDFAGRAMQGLVSKINVHEYKDLAEYSVRAADALLEALNK